MGHSNTGHFGPLTGFFLSSFQTTIWIPDHLTTRHKPNIPKPVWYSDAHCTKRLKNEKSLPNIGGIPLAWFVIPVQAAFGPENFPLGRTLERGEAGYDVIEYPFPAKEKTRRNEKYTTYGLKNQDT